MSGGQDGKNRKSTQAVEIGEAGISPPQRRTPKSQVSSVSQVHSKFKKPHLNREEFEINLSVPEIRGYHENALIKTLQMNAHLLYQVWIQAGLKRMLVPAHKHIKLGLIYIQ